MSVRVPKYRLHKATGQALVEIRGRRTYLGKYDSPSSHERYRQIIAELMSSPSTQVSTSSKRTEPLTIDELILLYFQFAKGYYVKDGQPTNEIVALRAALRRLRGLYGSTLVNEFGPKAFKLVRESMIQERLSRKYVNDSMARVTRMFRWAVAEELIPPAVFQAISSVPGLRKGRSNAKETAPIGPVSDDVVEATLPFLPEVVADMVRLQRLTGMRPAEVCILRPGDIDRSGEVWNYRPQDGACGEESDNCVRPKGAGPSPAILSSPG
jgi:integrase